jgi:protein-L-isoaspartate(D-aspartate) O-methyltransferase
MISTLKHADGSFTGLILQHMIQDSFRHQGLRRQLVQQLREKGINNETVLEAIGKIPRHIFMDQAFLEFAYKDQAFPIDCGQTISQPYTVAYQTQLLDPKKGEKVLEIGTGSGYQSAVLAETGAKVFTIERHKPLHENTRKRLDALNYFSVKMFYGDGFKGLPAYAPFDKILVTCGAPEIPAALVEQLKPGGILVIPVGPLDGQVMTTVLKKPDGSTDVISLEKFKFVPMLGDKAR